MIALLLFSLIAAAIVFQVGRKDAARDPWLSLILLSLLVCFPVLALLLPKVAVLPVGVEESARTVFPWGRSLLLVWISGMLIAGARLLLAVHGLRQWHRNSVKVARQGRVEIRMLAGIRSPVAAGVIQPVIFVPDSWGHWSEETREMVLQHEMAHHDRCDPLWRWLAEAARVVYWYHPLVHWMVRRFEEQCEYACDEIVLKGGASPAAYAHVLCDFASPRRMGGPLLAMAETSSLESRVRRMIQPPGQRGRVGMPAFIGLCTAVVLAMAGPHLPPPILVPPEEVALRLSANPFPGN